MSSADRRRHTRHDLRLRVQLSSGERTFALTSENVSLGGIFLATDGELPELHETVRVEVVLPEVNHGRDLHIPIDGVVLYRVEGRGCGVEFSWWTDEAKARREELAGYLTDMGFPADSLDGDALLSEASELGE